MNGIQSLGIMTGTSCDGADFALLSIKPDGEEKLKGIASIDFPQALQTRLLRAQSGEIDIREAAILARDYSRWLSKGCLKLISKWHGKSQPLLISVHGQTIWHEPSSAISVQLLDPSIIVNATGSTVACAFRQPDLAAGGEGAPLAPYYHWLRAVSTPAFRAELPFSVHNIGGIANLTCITRDKKKLTAFDTGPGNALIDQACKKIGNHESRFDRDGELAFSSLNKINWKRIEHLAQSAYFKRRPPKSTGRELFNEAFLRLLPGTGAALVANATALTAHTMARSYADFVLREVPLKKIFLSGGGSRNPALVALFKQEMRRLSKKDISIEILPESFAPAQHLEAMAFARLGFEALQGRPVSLPSVTGAQNSALGAGLFPGKNYSALLKKLKML